MSLQSTRRGYSANATVIKDLKPVIAKGNLGAALADDSFLAQVVITERRRSLLWPDGLELCADALRLAGEAPELTKKARRVRSTGSQSKKARI